jgi:hypothetical protein
MDETSVGMSLKAGRFLGSKDRVLVCGNSFNGTAVGNKRSGTTVQVLYSKFINEVDGPSTFVPTSELNLNGRCSDLEICGKHIVEQVTSLNLTPATTNAF